MTVMIIDIETYKNELAEKVVREKKVMPSLTIKDPAKQEADVIKKRASLLEKSALHWTTGKVIAVGYQVDKGPVESLLGETLSEKEMLLELREKIRSLMPVVLVGKSSHMFDFPFLRGRFAVHSIPVPHVLHSRACMKDVDDYFGGGFAGKNQNASLATYGTALGLPESKFGDSVLISKYYEDKDWKSIKQHVEDDITLTSLIYKRVTITDEEYDNVHAPSFKRSKTGQAYERSLRFDSL